MNGITIHYRQEFFGETTSVIPALGATAGIPRGLVGRQVANAEMLAALLRYSRYPQIDFLVDNDADASALRSLLKRDLPRGKKSRIKHLKAVDEWMSQPETHVIWEPQPPTASLSWTRSRLAPSRVALGGVTHALCSSNAVSAIRQLVSSPLRSVDRLVCTSEAVAHTARTLIDHWANVVGKTGDPELIQLETIPLGVECERHRPASPAERAEVRRELRIDDEADVVLFVGRLSHHAKSNPLPMFAACQRAAVATGRPVVLVLAGWYASDVVKHAFESEAARVAPLVRLVHVNGMDVKWRDRVWAVADVFVSLADSVQETFGLTVVEAMARGIAVVASDWNGYRETIQHERTGLLVPTTMVEGAGERALVAMHEDRLSYDHFLAAVGQTVCVCTAAACDAVKRLLLSPSTRMELSQAGQRRAQEFTWQRIIARYERLWQEQHRLMNLQQSAVTFQVSSDHKLAPNELIPSLRDLFAQYPSVWVKSDDPLRSGDQSLGDWTDLVHSPLANHSRQWRTSDVTIQQIVNAARTETARPTIAIEIVRKLDLGNQAGVANVSEVGLVDSVAWALKYDLLKPDIPGAVPSRTNIRVETFKESDITFTTTCMGRLEHLKQTLPRLVAQPGCHVVVVDYSCPDGCGAWVREHYPPEDVSVVYVPDRKYFNMVEAKNVGISMARSEWVCMIDADVVVAADFAQKIRDRLADRRFLRRMTATEGVGGTLIAQRSALIQVGLHDAEFQQWGEEDDDLADALRFIGHQAGAIPEELIHHLEHDDDMRTQHYESDDRRLSHLVNRVYRAVKWDIAGVIGSVPTPAFRRNLYNTIQSQIQDAFVQNGTTTIEIPLGESSWEKLSSQAKRKLVYTINVARND